MSYPEFFNDVFGPVMQPGSSSHTAGPCRLGFLAHCLVTGELKDISIELDRNGSYAGTFGVMFEDLGMLAGAYGLLPDDERIFDIKDILRREGITWRFVYTDFGAEAHPNAVRFILTNEAGQRFTLYGNSTGGGMIETVGVMGKPYRYHGDRYVTEYPFIPVLPVLTDPGQGPQLFNTMTQWRALAREADVSLSEIAIRYEEAASGWPRDRIISYMDSLRQIMERQTRAVYEEDREVMETPYTGFHYRKWDDYCGGRKTLGGSAAALTIRRVLGVQAQIRGVKMVPGPMGTGGGFLYSALRTAADELHSTDEEITDALFVAAGVGAICYSRTSPTGEVTGCAGECGVCGAMASAAIAHLAGGTPGQVESAASMALQLSLGWPCDPIPGGMNQPCFSRFITVAVMSLSFADLALSGRDAVIPFHEVVDTMDIMAKEMPPSYKCTSQGGICTSPTARACAERFRSERRADG